MLRTHSPLNSALRPNCVRLACLKHAASVHPEPGSNSPYELLRRFDRSQAVRRSFVASSQPKPAALIGPPTHRQSVQASLTTGVASYHSSVVKVRRAAPDVGVRRASGPRLYHTRAPCVKADEKPMQRLRLCIGPQGSRRSDCLVSPGNSPG